MKGMNPSKAPGPDGAHAMFFQKYWDFVGDECVSVCLNIFNEGANAEHINQTFITLIPKSNRPKVMGGFRPMSLCNVIYKLVAKSLAIRFKNVLYSIIPPTQSAFVPGRLISDNVIIGFECIHAIKAKRTSKAGVIAMKLDMSKAIIEWSGDSLKE